MKRIPLTLYKLEIKNRKHTDKNGYKNELLTTHKFAPFFLNSKSCTIFLRQNYYTYLLSISMYTQYVCIKYKTKSETLFKVNLQ